MSGNDNPDGFPRRQFVRFSGVAGAAAILVGAGAGRGLAAAAHPPPCGDQPSGPNPCSEYDKPICGSINSPDPLWQNVKQCNTMPNPTAQCLTGTNQTPCYVVLNGRTNTHKHNYLLSPRKRITGIECPFVRDPAAPNYWNDAWSETQAGGHAPVNYSAIGLGINSQRDRMFDQLHVHMAGILNAPAKGVQATLNAAEKAGHVAMDPKTWSMNVVEIEGVVPNSNPPIPATRAYRALVRKDLHENLFRLVYDNVNPPGKADMDIQTIIVTPRYYPNPMTQNGFYILSSDRKLRGPTYGGTSTCDELLVYGD